MPWRNTKREMHPSRHPLTVQCFARDRLMQDHPQRRLLLRIPAKSEPEQEACLSTPKVPEALCAKRGSRQCQLSAQALTAGD
jgi:hypothetical protein